MASNDEFKKQFGRVVKKYRTQKGWTQIQLAKAVYADEEKSPRVSEVENGKYDPQAATISDYCTALEIPFEEVESLKTDDSTPLSIFKRSFNNCTLESSFDALIAGEGIVTKSMGYDYYKELHKAYIQIQLEIAYAMKAQQSNDQAIADNHRQLGNQLLQTLKLRVLSIPEIIEPLMNGMAPEIDRAKLRFGLNLGWQLGRFDILSGSTIAAAQAIEVELKNEILTILTNEGFQNVASLSNPSNFIRMIVSYYEAADIEKHNSILLGIAAFRSSLVGASEEEQHNAQLGKLAESVFLEIDERTVPRKMELLKVFLQKRPATISDTISLIDRHW